MSPSRTPSSPKVRFPVEPRDIPPEKAARRLHLSLAEFEAKMSALQSRGFPLPDPTTGMFDLRAIDAWMDKRSHLTAPAQARDARESALARIANL